MDKDEQAIRNLIETWLRATRAGDVDTVLSLTTPDVVFLVAGQPPMLGQAAFGEALRMAIGNNVIESTSEIEEIVISGDLAYCRTLLHVTVTRKHDNMPMQRSGHALSILRRCEDGQWRLARDANMVK
jgi:uncharacterized protein (TIGR02246 family)